MPARSPTIPTYALLSVLEAMSDSVAEPVFADPKAVAATQMQLEFVARARPERIKALFDPAWE